jgi:lipoprotein-anchoring transpeptidase ErfK/SrfK
MRRARVPALCLLALGLLLGPVSGLRALLASSVSPPDAWAEQLATEHDSEASYDKRFPLYGVAFHVLAQVMSEASEHAEVIGYLRRGARFRATAGRAGRGCDRMWHELASGGFVCAGRGFALGPHPEGFEGAPAPPSIFDALPYRYAKNVRASAVQYWRVPTHDEELAVAKLLALAPVAPKLPSEPTEAPKLPDFARMAMEPGFYVSLDPSQEEGERGFIRTVRGAYVDEKALVDVNLGHAPGVVLRGMSDLPLGIAYRAGAKLMQLDAATGAVRVQGELPRYAAVPLTTTRTQREGRSFLLTRTGTLVSETALRILEHAGRPPLVPRGARLIHVNLAQQSLVAYDGERPVFATLVSTGKEGFETPKGVYRIYAKHVSATMDGTAGSDEVYSIEDVPWTMYFQGSYALHAAFWHDHFGNVRSHGCINLAPADARWLFRFTTPVLPTDWHGVIATHDNPGTWISID